MHIGMHSEGDVLLLLMITSSKTFNFKLPAPLMTENTQTNLLGTSIATRLKEI